MPIDARIPLGVQMPTPTDPLTQYGQVVGIQNAQNQGALAQFGLASAQRAEDKANVLTKALQSLPAGAGPEAVRDAYRQAGDAAGYLAAGKTVLESQKIGGEIKKTQQEIDFNALHEANKQAGSVLTSLYLDNNATPEKLQADLQAKLNSGAIKPDLANHIMQGAQGLTGDAFRSYLRTAANGTLDAADALKAAEARYTNTGGFQVQTNPNSTAPNLQNTPTPGEQLTAGQPKIIPNATGGAMAIQPDGSSGFVVPTGGAGAAPGGAAAPGARPPMPMPQQPNLGAPSGGAGMGGAPRFGATVNPAAPTMQSLQAERLRLSALADEFKNPRLSPQALQELGQEYDYRVQQFNAAAALSGQGGGASPGQAAPPAGQMAPGQAPAPQPMPTGVPVPQAPPGASMGAAPPGPLGPTGQPIPAALQQAAGQPAPNAGAPVDGGPKLATMPGFTPSPSRGLGQADPYRDDNSKAAAKYRNELDDRVQTGGSLMQRIQESEGLLDKFKAGAGNEGRLAVGRYLKSAGFDTLANRVAGGDVGAMQEFNKLQVAGAMEALKQSMDGQGRIAQQEFKVFQTANPNIELDGDAIKKIFAFQKRTFARDYAEQAALHDYEQEGGNPASFRRYWAQNQGPLTKRYQPPGLDTPDAPADTTAPAGDLAAAARAELARRAAAAGGK